MIPGVKKMSQTNLSPTTANRIKIEAFDNEKSMSQPSSHAIVSLLNDDPTRYDAYKERAGNYSGNRLEMDVWEWTTGILICCKAFLLEDTANFNSRKYRMEKIRVGKRFPA